MDIKELGRSCRKNKLICTFIDSDNIQWVSDGSAAFAYSAAHAGRETLIKQLGISDYGAQKVLFEEMQDKERVLHFGEDNECFAWKEDFEVLTSGGKLIIIANNEDATMIYEKYLRIVRDNEYSLYLRKYKKNHIVAVKDVSGRLLAVIMPVIYSSRGLNRMSKVIEKLQEEARRDEMGKR